MLCAGRMSAKLSESQMKKWLSELGRPRCVNICVCARDCECVNACVLVVQAREAKRIADERLAASAAQARQTEVRASAC